MEEKKIPIIGQYLKINEDAETLKAKNPMEQKLIKQFSDELNSNHDNLILIKNFEEISKNMIGMGIKPKMALNSFLVYKYSNIEDGLELLYVNQDGEYNHRYIESDEGLCFICDAEEKSHRSINKILLKKSFNRNSAIEEDETLKRKITQKEITLRKTLSKEINIADSLSKEEPFEIRNDIRIEQNSQKYRNNNNECPICMMEIQGNKSSHLTCSHIFCIDCVQEYLNEEIKNSRVSKITCPQKDCRFEFDEKKIKESVSDDMFYKYKKFKLREKYKNIPNAICCPIVNCEGYANKNGDNSNSNSAEVINKSNDNNNNKIMLENDHQDNKNLDSILEIKEPKSNGDVKGIRKKLKCNNGHELCSQCISAWHGNEGCEEDKEIKHFALTSGIIPKKCPKCRVWTEKNLGCNHMTCRICQYNWCWLCLQECNPDHYFQEGSPCFGKQFNEQPNPNNLFFVRLFVSHSIYYISTFFIVYLTIFAYNILSVNRDLNDDEGNNNNNNLEQQENNINANAGEIEINLNNQLLENNDENNNNNRNQAGNNGNRRLSFGQKIVFFLIGECLLFFLFLFLAISNGFFMIPLLTMQGQLDRLNNKYAKTLGFITFCILYTLFFLTGIIFSCLWLCLTTLYFMIRIFII